jgi:diguanylate cyclase (GGDEF)-like protein/PAS domain S-box-containing protein
MTPATSDVPSSSAAPTPEIFAEQVRLLYELARAGIVGMVFVAAVLTTVLWQVGNRSGLAEWMLFVVVVSVARYALIIAYRRAQPSAAEAPQWAHRFVAGAAFGGLCWGLAGGVLLPQQEPLAQVFITFVVGGMASGALAYLSSVRRAFAAYAAPALLPLAIVFIYLGGFLYIGMGIMVLAFTGLLLAASTRANAAYRDSFALRYENRQLIDNLAHANAELRTAASEHRRMENALDQQRERALVTLQSIGDAVITTDVEGVIDYLNPVAESLTGWSLIEVRGRPLLEAFNIFDESSEVPIENPVARCLREGRVIDLPGSLELVHRNGLRFAVEVSVAPIRDRYGASVGAVLAFRDVTQERLLTRKISYQASHDPLTGLINRREFEARLDRLLLSARGGQQEHALCYFDLDQFKLVNDTCGHAAGDELLRQLAACIQAGVRGSDSVARLGGDEFGVLLEGCTLEKGRDVAELLHRAIRAFRFVWEGRTYEIGASFGLVSVTADFSSLADVLAAADSACYVAKEKGRNRVHVYEPDDQFVAQRSHERRWVTRLRHALDEDRLLLHYQPIRSLGAPNDGEFCELLLRLHDSDGQVVAPGAFLPAAERYGLMPAVDRWVLRASLAALAPGGRCTQAVSINLSGQSLDDAQFLAFVVEQIETRGVDPRRLCFEITETAAIANMAGATRFITSLRARGCRFALDDFGSGLSSFGYLKNLPVDYLKISGHFVRGIVDDPIDRAMVASINDIGHVMGLTTIAECVESAAIESALREIGVDMAQGYHIAQPQALVTVARRPGERDAVVEARRP